MIKDLDIKELLIAELKINFFDISKACDVVGISLDSFNSYKGCDFFQSGLADARQWRDDFALREFKELIAAGNAQAIIEFQKMQRQSDDKNTSLIIRKKITKYLIETADTKALILRKFSDIFGESLTVAEKFYQIAKTEYSLLSPQERKKDLLQNEETSMHALFKKGKLNEIDMLERMIGGSLYDAEFAEYPKERSAARGDLLQYTQYLEELHEKRRREKESDDSSVFDKLDAVIARTTPDKIDELKTKIMNKGIECS